MIKIIEEKYIKLLQDIRSYFKKSEQSIHKARNEIKILDFDSEQLVVKSFKIPNFFNKIVYTFFRSTKAEKSYNNSVKIIKFVPKPIGYIEFKSFGLLHDSYFISEIFDYNFTIREVLLDKNFEDRVNIFKLFAKFTLELHEDGILHKDYSPGNILIKKNTKKYDFKIVDINRMEFKELTLQERLKNFSQLWAKNDDLKIIIDAYSELISQNKADCLKKALYYSQKHKATKNFKKRLKGKKVVD